MSELTSRRERAGRITARILLAALIFFGMRPFYPGFLFVARSEWARQLDGWPDRRAPGYRRLLLEAERIVPAGSRVAIVFPSLEWEGGYSYAYYRAQYFLAGRIVIPLAWTDGPRPARLSEAEYAVVYLSAIPRDGWEIVLSNADGMVARRSR
ncbi:MAG: hypothetical protein NDJ92_02190 [Thermoanaerobaculia bacterium]|nr:hypothetical protein [Thermoanaerobaculia bacterium]